MSVLVLDVGSTTVRASRVLADGSVAQEVRGLLAVSRPAVGTVEFDATALAALVLELSDRILRDGPVEGVGISAQRASTVLWDRASGLPVAPAIGWQDLRTTGHCLALRQHGVRLSPNQSATKLTYLLDAVDPKRERDLCFGTVDSWLAWVLSSGSVHVTDDSNAAVTGLLTMDGESWDLQACELLRIDPACLPRRVDSLGLVGAAEALRGAPPIAGLCGDQQASLIGQGCISPGQAKATFGTGGMLDLVVGDDRPTFASRGEAGTFPIIARSQSRRFTWGVEAVLLAAGICVEWLRDGLAIIDSVDESEVVAQSVRDSGGVAFVPAFGGLGTPVWDFGARGTLVGLDATTTRAHVVRAVLEGIANAGADLLESAEADSVCSVPVLRVDGGMTANNAFVQMLADAIGRPVERSAAREATTTGAAFLAGCAVGTWSSLEEACATIASPERVEPRHRRDRDRWIEVRDRSLRTVPLLSALEF